MLLKTKILISVCLFAMSGAAVFLSSSVSDAQNAPKALAKPAPKPVESATKVAIIESQPVVHARSAAISSCLPAISELSRLTLDAPHTSLSLWDKTDANEHMFSSIAGLKYDTNIAPRAISIIAAAPTAKHSCDGASVQIQPSSLACDVIQKNLAGAALQPQDLNGTMVLQGESNMRFALLPTAGNGCTVVSIGSYYAKN